ncbi:MAG: conjugative transfer signal peptidase TraF, partial [Proteobacteria bacterium]
MKHHQKATDAISKKSYGEKLAILSLLLLTISTLCLLLSKKNIIFVNLTRSMPLGVWIRSSKEVAHADRGDRVIVCPPNNSISQRAKKELIFLSGSCPGDYAPLLKEIIGLPGDTIREGYIIVYADGEVDSRFPLNKESISHFLVKPSHAFYLGLKEYWMIGSSLPSRSFDSRYFGPIRSENLIAVVEPFFTSFATRLSVHR